MVSQNLRYYQAWALFKKKSNIMRLGVGTRVQLKKAIYRDVIIECSLLKYKNFESVRRTRWFKKILAWGVAFVHIFCSSRIYTKHFCQSKSRKESKCINFPEMCLLCLEEITSNPRIPGEISWFPDVQEKRKINPGILEYLE